MEIQELIKLIKDFCREELGMSGKVIKVNKIEDGWLVEVEVVEEEDYMQQIARKDLLAIYEIELDQEGEIKGYQRTEQFQKGLF